MKNSLSIAILCSLFAFYLTACKKGPDVPVPQDKTCRIENFRFSSGVTTPSDSGLVSYYADGNPRRVLMGNGGTGSPHSLFIYDKLGRLTDHIGAYGGNQDPLNLPDLYLFEFWVRYAYADQNAASLPVGDTIRTAGQARYGQITFASQITIESFVYDAEKRIVQISATGTFPTPTRNFTYDANGNLVLAGVTYDTRKNYRQTNKVWMLVDRNYSKNNPFIATQYNAEGYPTLFPASNPQRYQDIFLRRSLDFKVMNYECTTAVAKRMAE
jgi:hypothetical protein